MQGRERDGDAPAAVSHPSAPPLISARGPAADHDTMAYWLDGVGYII